MKWILCVALCLGGCASKAVRCDVDLQAINKPAPVAAPRTAVVPAATP
jgi:hypothetical protein